MLKSYIFWANRYASSFTITRLINFLKVKASYYLGRITRRNLHWGLPYTISIEPTTSCNLQCPECPSGLRKFHRPTGKLEDKTLEEVLKQLGRYLTYITFYFQGEPLLHKDFAKFVALVKKHKIMVGTSTNAHFLDKEKAEEIITSGLDRLIISLDGTDEETYVKYRKTGDFNLVVNNIKNMVEAKQQAKSRTPFIELQFIVFKHNEHQIEDIKKLSKELGVDKLSLKTAQLYEFEEGNELMPGLVKYSRYQQDETGKYKIKGGLPNHCYRSWSGSVITWDGGVVPCCFDKDGDHRFGNIMENDYKNILQRADYKAFLQQILNDRKQIEICRNCTEGL